METKPLDLTLSILRNPYGWHEREVKLARLEAANVIESLIAEVAALRNALEECHRRGAHQTGPHSTGEKPDICWLCAALELAKRK